MKGFLWNWIGRKHRSELEAAPETNPANAPESKVEYSAMNRSSDGRISIEKNRVVVINPAGTGAYPVLDIPAMVGATVRINGRVCVGEQVVTAEDNIEVVLHSRAPSRTFAAEATEDNLSVRVRAHVVPGCHLHLEDTLPARKLVIRPDEHSLVPAPSSAGDVLRLLDPGVFQGALDDAAIAELCTSTTSTEAIVLRGLPPKAAAPGRYKPVQLVTEIDPQFRTRRYGTIPMGTVVAVYEPGIPGVPGRDVYGNEIPAPSCENTQKLGNGVVQVNGHVVAVRSGRPVFNKHMIDVVPELIISHDLTPEDGPIVFDGTVVIRGSVMDGGYVRASRSVRVYGSVFQATLLGEEGVYVSGSIVGSKVWAGFSQLIYAELLETVRTINEGLARFYAEYRVLAAKAKTLLSVSSDILRLPDLLLRERHANLAGQIDLFVERYSPHLLDIDEYYCMIVQTLRQCWHGIYRTTLTDEQISWLMNAFCEYQDRLEIACSSTSGMIRVDEVANSTLQAAGNIAVNGK